MISRLFLFVVLIMYTQKSNAVLDNDNEEEQSEIMRYVRDFSIFDSFSNLYANLKKFFGIKTKVIEEKRKRVNNAFKLFFSELNRKKVPIKPGILQNARYDKLRTGLRLRNKSSNVFDIRPETSAEQLIISHGYRSESHTILTEDGYMLTMQRVLPDLEKENRRTVLIHHGLLESAEDWLLLGKKRALPYILSDNGFDVWLLNARGNRYSKIHASKSAKVQEFWDFSWHEMGVYDLPAVITYVSEFTEKAEINFIGHSMGATALLVLLSTLPEYNYIIRSGILLAPLAFMYHTKGPIRVLADFYRMNGHQSLNFLGKMEFIQDGVFPDQIIEKFCKGDEIMCSNPLLLLANGGKEVLSEKLIEDILTHVPAGGSVKTMIHYVQSVKSGYFQMFDYGATDNMLKYRNTTPPLYDLSQVTLPMALFSSPSDWLATASDIQTLLPLLQEVNVHHVVKAGDFGHLDFVWSPDAPELVYGFILTILDQISPAFFQD